MSCAAPGAGGRDAHVEHERAGEFGECGVVERVGGRLVVLFLAGDEGDAGCFVAIGERDAGVAAGGLGGGDAGDDFVGHAGRLRAASSSARRAKMAGSPPFSRTTVRPFFAWRIIASLISV